MEKTAQEILENGILSAYCGLVYPDAKAQQDALRRIEGGISAVANDRHGRLLLFYQLGYMVSGEQGLVVNGMQFDSIDSLAAYIATIVNRPNEFSAFYMKLMNDQNELDPQFESWMIARGKRNELAAWKQNL